MSNEERIAALERTLGEMERRLKALEALPEALIDSFRTAKPADLALDQPSGEKRV